MPGIVNLSKFGKKDLIFIQCGLFFKPDMPALLWKINSRKYFREFLNFAVIFRYKLFGVTRLNFLVVGKTLPQICQNKICLWPVFSRIKIEIYLIKGSVLIQEKRVKKTRILACLTQYYNVKSVRIRNFSGPYFPAFELNTERWSVFLRIQSEWGKILTSFTHFSLFHYGTNLNRLRNSIGNYSEFSKISNSNLIYCDSGIVRIMPDIYDVRIVSSLKSSSIFT